MSLDEDMFLSRFLDTPEKRAKWLLRFRIAYIVWIIFMIASILFMVFLYIKK